MLGVSRDRKGMSAMDFCGSASLSMSVSLEMLRVVDVNCGRRLVDNVC